MNVVLLKVRRFDLVDGRKAMVKVIFDTRLGVVRGGCLCLGVDDSSSPSSTLVSQKVRCHPGRIVPQTDME